jgi:hypothetical protein
VTRIAAIRQRLGLTSAAAPLPALKDKPIFPTITEVPTASSGRYPQQ